MRSFFLPFRSMRTTTTVAAKTSIEEDKINEVVIRVSGKNVFHVFVGCAAAAISLPGSVVSFLFIFSTIEFSRLSCYLHTTPSTDRTFVHVIRIRMSV